MTKKQTKLINLFRFWAPVVLWAFVIFTFSSAPTQQASEIVWQDFALKKFAHIVEYGIFTVFIYRAFIHSGVKAKNAAIFSVLISFLYGISDEYHQSFTPGREPHARDVVFDTIGSILAIYSLWNLLPKAPKKLQTWAENYQIPSKGEKFLR